MKNVIKTYLFCSWHITQIAQLFGGQSHIWCQVQVERLLHKPWDAAQVGAATGQPAMEKTRAATANATWHWGLVDFMVVSWSFYWGIEW